ncbi:MAG: signal peptidase I [Deltaproteobacteria bacterium]|nr:signal peptidase I [Deltaproteobacteria bacterium]
MTGEKHCQELFYSHGRWLIFIVYFIVTLAYACSDNSGDLSRYKAYKFPSDSMAPTLLFGDRILADMQFYKYHQPERGDLIIFVSPLGKEKDWVKRVIAIEKDIIEAKNSKVHLNGQPLKEPYTQYTGNEVAQPIDNFGPVSVPDGTLFVMGDNRDHSYDSRYFGPIPVKNVKGKVRYIYWSKKWGRIGTKLK